MKPAHLLLFPAALLLPCLTHAHGEHGTTQDMHRAEIPPLSLPASLWESILPGAEAAMAMTIKESEGYRYIKSDGLPDHTTGQFPNRGNPNRISSQDMTYRVPLHPKKRSGKTLVSHATFGVAINGVPFDAATAEYWNNDRRSDWNIEAMTDGINLGLDSNNAHVQPNGAYHYHALPTGIAARSNYRKKPLMLGYAADGFPIYTPYGYRDANDYQSRMIELKSSYRIRAGTRSGGPGGRYDGTYTRDYEYVAKLGDLDACNGRSGVTPEYPGGTYYYVITSQFPYIPRCWYGKNPDRSFQKSAGGGRGGPSGRPTSRPGQGGTRSGSQGGAGGRGGGPPPEAFTACENKSLGSSCSVRTPRGALRGSCRKMREDRPVCVPDNHHPGGPPPR